MSEQNFFKKLGFTSEHEKKMESIIEKSQIDTALPSFNWFKGILVLCVLNIVSLIFIVLLFNPIEPLENLNYWMLFSVLIFMLFGLWGNISLIENKKGITELIRDLYKKKQKEARRKESKTIQRQSLLVRVFLYMPLLIAGLFFILKGYNFSVFCLLTLTFLMKILQYSADDKLCEVLKEKLDEVE